MPDRPGFFPNGQCRHYQLAGGWAKVWCIRTEDGHTEHETPAGVRWDHTNGRRTVADLDWTKLTAKLEADARQDVAEAKAVYDRATRRLRLLETLRDHLAASSTDPSTDHENGSNDA